MWFHLRLLEACNLRCKHCYAINNKRGTTMSLSLFEEIIGTIKQIPRYRTEPPVAYLSGGEPLLHPDFDTMLARGCEAFRQVNVLTNGILLEDKIEQLVLYPKRVAVQISLEGDHETHDAIRGPRSHDAAVRALRLLQQRDIPHWISYTVSIANHRCFEAVIDLAAETGSYQNNVTPYCGDAEQMLTIEQWRRFKRDYEAYADKHGDLFHGPNVCGFTYDCAAYHCGLTYNPDGTFVGCARDARTPRDFREAPALLRGRPGVMSDACMRAKWRDADYFAWRTKLMV